MKEIFEKIKSGEITLEEFEEWMEEEIHMAYCSGADEQAYQISTYPG